MHFKVSKNQTGRKRKQPVSSSGPANSSGTANTAGPSPSSAPSTPSTHTPGDVISMPALPHSGTTSKPLMMFGTDGAGTLTSPSNQLVSAYFNLLYRLKHLNSMHKFSLAFHFGSGMIKILNCGLIWIVWWRMGPLMTMSSLFYHMMIQTPEMLVVVVWMSAKVSKYALFKKNLLLLILWGISQNFPSTAFVICSSLCSIGSLNMTKCFADCLWWLLWAAHN